jgi:hypothetical protein
LCKKSSKSEELKSAKNISSGNPGTRHTATPTQAFEVKNLEFHPCPTDENPGTKITTCFYKKCLCVSPAENTLLKKGCIKKKSIIIYSYLKVVGNETGGGSGSRLLIE